MVMKSPQLSARFRPIRAPTESWMGWTTGMRNAILKRPRNKTRRARIMAYFECFAGEVIQPRAPTFVSPAGARWFQTFVTRRSGFAVRFLVQNRGKIEGQTMRNLQEIKVVENQKHGQEYID